MRRKGFLKRIIGALCVGVLIGMPVTVNAAEKEDVVGEWTGGSNRWASVVFDENGNATDPYNKKPYKIESGSLEVTNINTSGTETVSYDLWRGEVGLDKDKITEEQIKANAANAVLYQEIKPGEEMVAWNVFLDKVGEGWKTYGPATITKVEKTDTGSNGSSSTADSDKAGSASPTDKETVSPARRCEHNYEWVTTTEPTETENGESSYMCTSCGDVKARQPVSADVVIRNNLLASIKNAEAGSTVSFSNKAWLCYPQYVLDALKEKGGISLKTDFTFEGKNYSFTIPAGSDYANLEQADFYGFMYLSGAFNGTVVE